VNSVKPMVVVYAAKRCRIMSYCLSAIDAKNNVHGKFQIMLRDTSIAGDTAAFTVGDGIMMKSWLVDFFADKITSENCDMLAIVGTSAVNCGISSNNLYYIFLKGHPRSFLELIQLLGRLKCGGERIVQDRILVLLSIPKFISVCHSILRHDDKIEMDRQMKTLRIVTQILTDRDKRFKLATEQYYGSESMNPSSSCDKMCLTYRGESAKIVSRSFLIDCIEASIFNKGPVTVSTLCTKIMKRKGSVWVIKSSDVSSKDGHELVMLMWVHHIIKIHWSDQSLKR